MFEFLRVKTTECRLGIVGQYASGKSVFLTSLINHLEDNDPGQFAVGTPQTEIRRFTKLPPDPGWTEFPYAANRDYLVHAGKWPEKTSDRLQYHCRFERSDRRFSDTQLKLFDLPGERIADAAMLGRSYEEWSIQYLQHLQTDRTYRDLCHGYFELFTKPDAIEAEWILEYKRALAGLILNFKPLISPSTFLIDTNGGKARSNDRETLANDRFCGLDFGTQFTPLPEKLHATPIGQVFKERYQRYQTDVVEHFLQALRTCHALIVLVDIPMILAGGVGMYDDNQEMIRNLFAVLKPGETTLQTGLRHFSKLLLPRTLRPAWINRVAFVAPKLDLIHPTDRDRVSHLLKRMVGKVAANQHGLASDYFSCAAVVSAKPISDREGRTMMGIPLRDESGRKIPIGPEQRFTHSELPDDWPLNWEPGTYSFPEVYPVMPRRKDRPPEQLNLDRVLSFVLG